MKYTIVVLLPLLLVGCDMFGVAEKQKEQEGFPSLLKLLEGEESPPNPVIPATDGSEHLYTVSSMLFNSFQNDIDKESKQAKDEQISRPEIVIVAYQATQPTTYTHMVQAAGIRDSLTLSEHQLIEFTRQNTEWIQDRDYITFALLEIDGDVHLVSVVGQSIALDDLDDPTLWPVEPVRVSGGPDGPGVRYEGYYVRLIVPNQ